MENVPGMVKGKMKLIFAEVMRELKASGYRVRCQKLNTMYFGVPQSRERLIFIGVRDDLGITPSFPKAQTRPIAIRDAFRDLEFIGIGLTHTAAKIVHLMRQGNNGKQFANQYGHELHRLRWDRPSPTMLKNFRQSGAMGLIHPDIDRHIGIQEATRIASFHDKFQLIGNINNSGNASATAYRRDLCRR